MIYHFIYVCNMFLTIIHEYKSTIYFEQIHSLLIPHPHPFLVESLFLAGPLPYFYVFLHDPEST